jgi:hypothetical protein
MWNCILFSEKQKAEQFLGLTICTMKGAEISTVFRRLSDHYW